MVVKYVDDPKNADWWLCGSMDMVKSMKEILAEIGTDVKKIKIEGWG
jgi:ferredoxin-NADP reductase